MNIELDYILGDKCMAETKIITDDFEFSFESSCLYDSFSTLIQTAKKLLLIKKIVVIPFFNKPSDPVYQLVVKKSNDRNVNIELRLYRDMATYNRLGALEYDLIFEGETTLKAYIDNIYNIGYRIKRKYGFKEYKKMFMNPFPEEYFNKLSELIEESKVNQSL